MSVIRRWGFGKVRSEELGVRSEESRICDGKCKMPDARF